ncbi:DNA-directed RNA polymerase II subunit 4 [Senna tora]|uniref:DNA-directed RNA polymerase II subunit 4 n=1 Tax=Senna tora TaxID=362788 RepID=A0A834TJ05_9FABA|nr:DNA-directed RNA polymerase II subunit 4 [Senna tora]
MEPTFKTEVLKELEDLKEVKQSLQQGLRQVQEAFLDIVLKMECVLSMYKVYDARVSSITKKIMESPEYELEPELNSDSVLIKASEIQETIDELELHQKKKEIPSPVTRCVTDKMETDSVSDKMDISSPPPSPGEEAFRASIKMLQSGGKISPLKERINRERAKKKESSPLELSEKSDPPLGSGKEMSYKEYLLKEKEAKEAIVPAKKTVKVSTGESSEIKPQISVNPKLQTLKISFEKEFVHKEDSFPLLKEEQKLAFEADYRDISQIIYSGNSETIDTGFLIDFKSEFPKVVIHDADKMSVALIKSLYDLGYVSRIYFKDPKVLKFLPKPIIDAVLKFKFAGDTKMVTCLKISKASLEYTANNGELVEISPARQLNMKFKKEKGDVPEINADFIARRRAFSLVEYWRALSKRVIQGNGWTYTVSEKLVVMCHKEKPFQEPVLKQLAAFVRKIELLQVAGSANTRSIMSRAEEEDASELKFGDDFEKAKCLMNSEVALLLEHKFEQFKHMSEDSINQAPQVFDKSLQYVKRFSRFSNQDAIKQVREVLSRYQLAEYELAVLGNLCPESVEEALSVVPTLKAKGRLDTDAIEKLLNDLLMIKKFE